MKKKVLIQKNFRLKRINLLESEMTPGLDLLYSTIIVSHSRELLIDNGTVNHTTNNQEKAHTVQVDYLTVYIIYNRNEQKRYTYVIDNHQKSGQIVIGFSGESLLIVYN